MKHAFMQMLLILISASTCFAVDSTFYIPQEVGKTAVLNIHPGGGDEQTVVIDTTRTWTVPDGVTQIQVTVIGGGRGGALQKWTIDWAIDKRTMTAGSGGYGGGAATKTLTVSPGQTFHAEIGEGGAAATMEGSSGQPGGTTSFASISADHVGHNGDINMEGGPGTAGLTQVGWGVLPNCASPGSGGAGATEYGGPGGTAENNGATYGGGGGGGCGTAGRGAPGAVIIKYIN